MAALDSSRLAGLRQDLGDDGVVEVAEVMLREAPKRIAEMQAAFKAKDRATLERSAHSLKSNARLFGANALAELCRDLEESSRSAIPAKAQGRIEEIGRHYREAEPEIRALVERLRK